MASIRRRENARGDVSFQVLFRAYGRQTAETFRGQGAEQAAARFAALVDRIGGEAASEVRTQASGGAASTPTVSEAVSDHVEAIGGITIGTRRDYRKIAAKIAASPLGPIPVDMLTQEMVQKWIDGQDVAAKTKRNRHSLLYAAMQRQVKKKVIPENPCEQTRISRTERREMVTLTVAELNGILDYLDRHWHPLVRTLAGTGLRFGEATALQVRDVDLRADPARLTVARAWKHTDGHGAELGAPKTGRGRRVVSLAPDLVEVLAPCVRGRPRDAFVFTNKAGRHIRQNSFHEIWTAALDDANDAGRLDKRPRIHDLRHTHASWLIARGVPLPVIQRRLGHESITTTVDTYGHLADDALSVAAQASVMAGPAAVEAGVVEGEIVDGDLQD